MAKIWSIQKVNFTFIIILLVLLLSLPGCGLKKKKGLMTIEGDPAVLYKQGLALFNGKRYKAAIEKFEQLKSSFPDSPPFTILAELKVADAHFHLSENVEAAALYEEFRKIHPTYEEIAYVQFQIGMSYFNQTTTADRDPTLVQKALANFEYLVANYPPSLFTEKAKEKIWICKRKLAEHEFRIGSFYYERENYEAAVPRLQELLEKYPEWLDQDKTLLLLAKSCIQLGQEQKARETLARLLKEYPGSLPAKEARTILARGRFDIKVPSRLKTILTKRPYDTRVAFREEKRDLKKGKKFAAEPVPEGFIFVKYEEEGEKTLPLQGRTPAAKGVVEEGRSQPIQPEPMEGLKIALLPEEESSRIIPPAKAEPARTEQPAAVKKPVASLPGAVGSLIEKGEPKKRSAEEVQSADSTSPIDITSDRVESYSKENLIQFKGNVIARQKDIVIYADSIEARIVDNGKGIDRVVAGGNVKIQQGLRVANCEKAVFYNLAKKVVLTGDPKVWEGDNTVTGEEIVFDIEQNQMEVKGGTGGRGKVKVYPKEEPEKKE